jgi:cation transport ATPase
MKNQTMTPNSSSILDIGIGGMTCASCVSRVARTLTKIPGVLDEPLAEASVGGGTMVLSSASLMSNAVLLKKWRP